MTTYRVRLRIAATALAALAVGAGIAVSAADWPQFRGVHRDGVSPEIGLAARWPAEGPREVWRVPLGEGFSAISVAGQRLYTMYAGDADGTPTEFAAAFETATGKQLWKTPVGEKYDTEFGNGPRATPTVDGDAVYVLSSRGVLFALSSADGKQRWKVDLIETFGAKLPHWGFSTSPLVDGDRVVLEAGGGEGKSYVGLNKSTGEVAWSSGDGGPGYNSALAVNLGGKHRYVYVSGTKLMGIDRDGKQIWSRDWPEGETHAMPLFIPPDRIYASGAEGVGARLFSVRENGGTASLEQLWENQHMRNHFSSSVVSGKHIYGFDNATLKSIAVEDAGLAWAKRGMGKGSLILADGKLLVLTDRGKLLLVEATPEAYRETGAVQALEGRCWTAPTLSGGRVYLRDQKQMVAYDVQG